MKKRRVDKKKTRLQLLHQYYRYTGFYRFILLTVKRTVLPILGLILLVVLVNSFIFDLNLFLQQATDTYSSFLVYTIFFISESFLGMIPPEIFIAWADKTPQPWFSLTGLAVLAYMGGSVSYHIGRLILSIPAVTRYVRFQIARHIQNLRRWGGFMIVISAFLPLPFSIASMAAGLIEYDYRQYLLWALARIIRFYLYALIVFNVV